MFYGNSLKQLLASLKSDIFIIMTYKILSLLMLMVTGSYAKPAHRPINDSLNKIDHKIPGEAKNVDVNNNQDFNITSASSDITTSSVELSTTVKPGLLTWFLAPLTQKVQFSPQSFLNNRLSQFKETLNNFGVQVREDLKGKQLGNANGLLNLVGVNDSGFYTNRLEPAGFFGGNGWLANKGGIVGGPGAILSTGSILTDYPTPYKKK